MADKNKGYVSINPGGPPIGVNKMRELIIKEFDAQEKRRKGGGEKLIEGNKLTPSYKVKANEAATHLKDIIETTMKRKIQANALGKVAEKNLNDIFLNAQTMNWTTDPGAAGYFIEKELFGLKRDNKQTADLDQLLGKPLPEEQKIELKQKSLLDDHLDIGGITIYGLDKEISQTEQDELKTIALVYKLLIKMRNLLYMYMVKEPEHKRLGFRAITLYTEIYIQAVYDWINHKTEYEYYKITPHKKNDKDGTVHIQYELYMNLTPEDFLGGLKKLEKLYMIRTDILNEIETGGISARDFFGRLGVLEGYPIKK